MQPRLRRGSGSKNQVMKVYKTVPKNRRNIIGFFKLVQKKQEYIRFYFWDLELDAREADSLRRFKI